MIANAKPTAQYKLQIKNGKIINVTVSVKSSVRAKKIIVGILAHVLVRVVGI